MKRIQGTPYNINKDIIGRISFGKKNIFRRGNEIFICKNIQKPLFGYIATITETIIDTSSRKPICVVNSIEDFHEGDIVIINNKGEIIFVYEINSLHNALMVTEKCNHRCIMCPQPPVLKERDKTPFNLKLISLVNRNTREIGLTGGEPTLIGDNLFKLIKHIKKDLPRTAISILSNGVRFADNEYALKLALCKHPDLQVDIPIFSDIAKDHNQIVGANTFYNTIKGLYNLALYKQRIGIRIVIHKLTYKRLPQLAEYIYRNFPFVCQVAFMQMETIGYAEDNISKLWIDPADYNEELSEAVNILDMRGLNTYIYNAQLCVLSEHLRKFAVQSISDWKDIYLDKCEDCNLRGQCGGLFSANRKYVSKKIAPVKLRCGV